MTAYRLILAAVLLSPGLHAQAPAPQNEEFDLDIKQEQIVETNFTRSTSLLKQNEKICVEAGAAVSAGRIDVTMRGVTGHVRFRANLDAIERLFRRQ